VEEAGAAVGPTTVVEDRDEAQAARAVTTAIGARPRMTEDARVRAAAERDEGPQTTAVGRAVEATVVVGGQKTIGDVLVRAARVAEVGPETTGSAPVRDVRADADGLETTGDGRVRDVRADADGPGTIGDGRAAEARGVVGPGTIGSDRAGAGGRTTTGGGRGRGIAIGEDRGATEIEDAGLAMVAEIGVRTRCWRRPDRGGGV
jgi:hypothetical protein